MNVIYNIALKLTRCKKKKSFLKSEKQTLKKNLICITYTLRKNILNVCMGARVYTIILCAIMSMGTPSIGLECQLDIHTGFSLVYFFDKVACGKQDKLI